jgi:hypothetical protein
MRMASRAFRVTLITAVLAAAVTHAQQRSSSTTEANPLQVFAPLIGAQWAAELPGGQVSDVQVFEWTFDRKFVRNTHEVRLKDGQVVYSGETIYAWDSRNTRIIWWYWNATGGSVTGTALVDSDGALTTEGENHGPKDQIDRTRSRMRIGADAWTFEAAQQKDGKWIDQPARTYRRMAARRD